MIFRIPEDARNLIKVDSTSGVIRAVDVFDYESLHNFRFTVTVEDNGEPAFTSTATVCIYASITIKNKNRKSFIYIYSLLKKNQ